MIPNFLKSAPSLGAGLFSVLLVAPAADRLDARPGCVRAHHLRPDVNTYGGLAPARAGLPNEVVWVPYRAEYYFYRAL